ncbi:hypothetical protein Tco_0970786 [Tanacetum coccineum]
MDLRCLKKDNLEGFDHESSQAVLNTSKLFWCDALHTEAVDQEFEAFFDECFSEDIRQLIIGLNKVQLNNCNTPKIGRSGNMIRVLEDDLRKTKKTYSSALTKLILRVKKLEAQVKIGKARRRARIVHSDDEDIADDSSK